MHYELRTNDNPEAMPYGTSTISTHETHALAVDAEQEERRAFEASDSYTPGAYLQRVIVAVGDEPYVGTETVLSTTSAPQCRHCGEPIEPIPDDVLAEWAEHPDYTGAYTWWHPYPERSAAGRVMCGPTVDTFAEPVEPALTCFVYLVEGQPYVGTIEDYAKADEHSHHAGLDVPDVVWYFVRTAGSGHWQPVARPVQATCTDFNDDDFATVTVRVFGEEASYRIDGRA